MKKAFLNILKVSPAIALSLLTSNSAFAGEVNEQVTSVSQLSQESNNLAQVTSVSQFSDVQPTDWAFQALQSLVERYACTAGYPNGTFRGNRALSRYEFAAGLNSCLDRVNELIATATADMVSKQDLATLQRLQEEYSNELQTVKGQADALEARTGELEANQFSTTTKLSGEAIFSLSQNFADNVAVFGRTDKNNASKEIAFNSKPTFSNRVRLTLNSSFRGTDQLQTRLNSINIVANNTPNSTNNSVPPNVTNTNMTRLGYDSTSTSNFNTVSIDKLNYAFNLTDKIRVKIDATGGELNENVDVFNPDFRSSGSGSLSRYGRFSPIYRQANDGTGVTVNVKPNDKFVLSAAYFATGRNASNNSTPGFGITDGNNTIFGQLAFKPNKAINLGLAYAHNYVRGGIVSAASLFGDTGSKYANDLSSSTYTSDRTEANHYGLQVSLQPTPRITLGAWGGYTTANSIAASQETTRQTYSYEMFYWATTLGIKDFLKEGNTLGLIFGQSPRVTGATEKNTTEDGTEIRGISQLKGDGYERNSSYHIEGLYKMKISDNVLVTPGVLVILNPENDDRNKTQYVGTLRTTFTF